jgi:hypothetical protein
MINESVIFKDGKGITQEVTYLGPLLTDGILKRKIRTWNDTDFLVNGILLFSLELQDIATIPVTVEQYAVELPKLMHPQLEQISNRQILDDDQCELMILHYKMNHLPLPAMITLAEKGKINKRLAKLKNWLPISMSCIFGTAHCKPWQYKGSCGAIQKETDNASSKCVIMDQLVSAQLGLRPQMAGFLTNLRIWGANKFVDHFSDYVFVALVQDLTLDKTLLAKTSFEQHANKGGVTINSYHANNGCFADSGFQQAIKNADQKIIYCIVGAHHQNGIVE